MLVSLMVGRWGRGMTGVGGAFVTARLKAGRDGMAKDKKRSCVVVLSTLVLLYHLLDEASLRTTSMKCSGFVRCFPE